MRGLLRRPEATLLVQKMQNGELKPGERAGLKVFCFGGGVGDGAVRSPAWLNAGSRRPGASYPFRAAAAGAPHQAPRTSPAAAARARRDAHHLTSHHYQRVTATAGEVKGLLDEAKRQMEAGQQG